MKKTRIKQAIYKFFESKLAACFFVALSGLLTPFTFAPYYLFWLMPILLGIFLLFAFVSEHPIKLAYLWGFCAYGAQFYWVFIALHDIAGLATLYALPLSALFPAYLALYPAICFWALGHLKLSPNKRLLFGFPLLWLICEYIREHALTGFGWGALGYSQVSESPLAGFAPVGGLYLVTLMVTLITVLWVFILRTKQTKLKIYSLVLSLVFIGLGAYFKTVQFTTPTGQSASVALVQGNIEQSLKWQESEAIPTVEKYYQMVSETKADIMILPEAALPFFQQDIPDIMEQFALVAKENKTNLVVGITRFSDEGSFLNAAVDLSNYNAEEPENQPFYAKNHLVPFGEYIPIQPLLGWLYTKMDIPLLGGETGGVAQPPLAIGNQKIAFNICYEDSFGDELIASAKQSTLLANISNMAWYGNSHAMSLHLQHSQMRALELGRYMVRSTNTGMTAVINPKGTVEALAAPNTQQVLQWRVQGHSGLTPFMKMGSSIPIIIFSCVMTFLIYLVAYRATKNVIILSKSK